MSDSEILNTKKCTQCELIRDIKHFGKKDKCYTCVGLRKRRPCITCGENNKKDPGKARCIECIQEFEKNKKIVIQKIRFSSEQKIENKKRNSREHFLKNKEKILAQQRERRKLPNQKKKRNEKNKSARKQNPSFKLKQNISRRIRGILKLNDSRKNCSFLKKVNFTLEQLRIHLESLFEPWMNWSNYGIYEKDKWIDTDPSTWTWNIDHKIPQSDLQYNSMDDENFKICWALNNLRPYSSKQNLLDGVARVRHQTMEIKE